MVNREELEVWIRNMNTQPEVYEPDIKDLFSLYSYARQTRVTTILEIGSGWSTLVLAQALLENKRDFGNAYTTKNPLRHSFTMNSIDASSHYAQIAQARLNSEQSSIVNMLVCTPRMSVVENRVCHVFDKFPSSGADLIYLDGPDCDQVLGEANGISVNPSAKDGGNGLPMSADLIKLEYFLEPGSTVIVDGRGANAEFLRSNFKRKWRYEYHLSLDQHFFYLESDSWGPKNTQHMQR